MKLTIEIILLMNFLYIQAQNLSVNDTLNYGKYYQQEEIWNRVAYGTRARRGQFPFFARVISNTRNGCGGSLISSLWVLTAGHCIYEAEHWYILLGTIKKPGTDNFTDDYTILLSKTGIQHPNSKVSGRRPPPHDIGLVKLPKRLKFNAYMRPISLPLRINPNNNLVNLKVRSCGFGRTETGRDSNHLLYVDLIIISHKECRKYFLNSVITRHIVCAQGYSYESVALGDSGGPLFYYNDRGPIIVGIVSFVNTKGCTLGYPSGFTRVDPYLRWINKVTGIWIPAH